MKHIYLVRHGSYDNPHNILPGRLPVTLSKSGNMQAQKLATFFQNRDIEKIFSSEVLRCKQTSEIISQGKIPVKFDQRLLEIHSAYQGFRFEPGEQLDWKEFSNHQSYLGGESYEDVRIRSLDFWNDLVKTELEHVIICTHGDSLHGIYQELMDQPFSEDLAELPDDYQTTASIREVMIDDSGEVMVKPMIKNEDLG